MNGRVSITRGRRKCRSKLWSRLSSWVLAGCAILQNGGFRILRVAIREIGVPGIHFAVREIGVPGIHFAVREIGVPGIHFANREIGVPGKGAAPGPSMSGGNETRLYGILVDV